MIGYLCAKCGTRLESEPSLAGRFDFCPVCQSVTTVPDRRKLHTLLWWIAGGVAVVAIIAAASLMFWRAKHP